MQINVTQEDIDKGLVCSYSDCPVARALFRVTGRRYDVTSDCHGLVKFPAGEFYDLNYNDDLPYEVKKLIDDFDNKLKVKPITFEFIEPVWI